MRKRSPDRLLQFAQRFFQRVALWTMYFSEAGVCLGGRAFPSLSLDRFGELSPYILASSLHSSECSFPMRLL